MARWNRPKSLWLARGRGLVCVRESDGRRRAQETAKPAAAKPAAKKPDAAPRPTRSPTAKADKPKRKTDKKAAAKAKDAKPRPPSPPRPAASRHAASHRAACGAAADAAAHSRPCQRRSSLRLPPSARRLAAPAALPLDADRPRPSTSPLSKRALELVRSRKRTEANETRNAISDPVAKKLVEWAILRSDDGGADFARYIGFHHGQPDLAEHHDAAPQGRGQLFQDRHRRGHHPRLFRQQQAAQRQGQARAGPRAARAGRPQGRRGAGARGLAHRRHLRKRSN